MGTGEIVALAGAAVTIFGSIGGVIRWAGRKFEAQAGRLRELEHKNADLFREQSLTLVRLERFRLAFQMVAAELARKSPGNNALSLAKALLDEAFKVDADTPKDMRDQLKELDRRTEAARQGENV